MMTWIYAFSGEIAYILVIGSVFMMTFMLWMMLAKKSQGMMEGYKETFTDSASTNMSDMFLFIDPNQLFIINIVAMVVMPSLVWLVTGDIPAMIATLAIVILLPSMLYKSMYKRRLKRFETQLPDALAMVSGAMRAGASLNVAMEGLVKEQPAPISQEFELLLKEQRIGVDFEASLKSMEERIPLQDFSMLVTALRINREVGGNIAETMESLGETLRRKAMMEGKIESLTAQGKLQGIVMTGLPILLGTLLNFIEPEAMEKLWTTSIGWIVLSIIVVMEIMGNLMIKKITSIDV